MSCHLGVGLRGSHRRRVPCERYFLVRLAVFFIAFFFAAGLRVLALVAFLVAVFVVRVLFRVVFVGMMVNLLGAAPPGS